MGLSPKELYWVHIHAEAWHPQLVEKQDKEARQCTLQLMYWSTVDAQSPKAFDISTSNLCVGHALWPYFC